MNTAWILLLTLWPGPNQAVSFDIKDLVSAQECERVARIVQGWQKRPIDYKCIEVIRK